MKQKGAASLMRSREAADQNTAGFVPLIVCCADVKLVSGLASFSEDAGVKLEFSQIFLSTESPKWIFMHLYAFYSIVRGREREGDGREEWHATKLLIRRQTVFQGQQIYPPNVSTQQLSAQESIDHTVKCITHTRNSLFWSISGLIYSMLPCGSEAPGQYS